MSHPHQLFNSIHCRVKGELASQNIPFWRLYYYFLLSAARSTSALPPPVSFNLLALLEDDLLEEVRELLYDGDDPARGEAHAVQRGRRVEGRLAQPGKGKEVEMLKLIQKVSIPVHGNWTTETTDQYCIGILSGEIIVDS